MTRLKWLLLVPVIAVVGSIPVTFADYGIPNPSFGPVSTDDHGQIEFKVVFAHS